jgi:hypothetical protein
MLKSRDERVQNFIEDAESSGLAAELRLKAGAQHDMLRRQRVRQLLDVMSQRETKLNGPAEALRLASIDLNKAKAVYQAVCVKYHVADYDLFMAQAEADHHEGRLRGELRSIAPACVEDTSFKLHALRNELNKAIRSRSSTYRDELGRTRMRDESNVSEIALIMKELEIADAEVAEIGRKCEAILQDCKAKAAPHIFPEAIARLFETVA